MPVARAPICDHIPSPFERRSLPSSLPNDAVASTTAQRLLKDPSSSKRVPKPNPVPLQSSTFEENIPISLIAKEDILNISGKLQEHHPKPISPNGNIDCLIVEKDKDTSNDKNNILSMRPWGGARPIDTQVNTKDVKERKTSLECLGECSLGETETMLFESSSLPLHAYLDQNTKQNSSNSILGVPCFSPLPSTPCQIINPQDKERLTSQSNWERERGYQRDSTKHDTTPMKNRHDYFMSSCSNDEDKTINNMVVLRVTGGSSETWEQNIIREVEGRKGKRTGEKQNNSTISRNKMYKDCREKQIKCWPMQLDILPEFRNNRSIGGGAERETKNYAVNTPYQSEEERYPGSIYSGREEKKLDSTAMTMDLDNGKDMRVNKAKSGSQSEESDDNDEDLTRILNVVVHKYKKLTLPLKSTSPKANRCIEYDISGSGASDRNKDMGDKTFRWQPCQPKMPDRLVYHSPRIVTERSFAVTPKPYRKRRSHIVYTKNSPPQVKSPPKSEPKVPVSSLPLKRKVSLEGPSVIIDSSPLLNGFSEYSSAHRVELGKDASKSPPEVDITQKLHENLVEYLLR